MNFLTMIFLSLTLLVSIVAGPAYAETRKCEEINIPMCKGIGYNATAMPNIFHHDSQEEAGLEVHQFWPLVEIQCSDDLKFFLCSMYTPICIEDYPKPLPACRSVCNRAKAGCAPIMVQYGFTWPDRMNCEDLPKFGDANNLCMDSKNGEEPISYGTPIPDKVLTISPKKDGKRLSFNKKTTKTTEPTVIGRKKNILSSVSPSDCRCECRDPLIKLDDLMDRRYYNRVETGGLSNCGQPCHSIFFTKPEQEDAVRMITMFAMVCFVCTFLTIATFLLDTERFKYPERSIIFICGCYLMVSSGFLVRWWVGHDGIACDGALIRYQGTGPGPAPCVLVFVLIYFFTIAASVWWVILCFTWFLAAGLKWGNEAISGYSQYFHLLALLVPTVLSLVVLGIGAVDGDPFTGICSVGNMDTGNLKSFLLIPLFISLCIGVFLLIAGFYSMFRIRKVIRQQAKSKADKLDKLMIRIVIFSLLYAVPGFLVLSSHYYEFWDRKSWEANMTCPCSIPSERNPVYTFFLLKYIGSLVVGIASGFWIWSPKTLDCWGRFFGRMCCGSSSVSSSRSGGSQLMGSQYIPVTNVHRQAYKQISMGQQLTYSSTSHIGSNCNTPGVLMKQVPLSHV